MRETKYRIQISSDASLLANRRDRATFFGMDTDEGHGFAKKRKREFQLCGTALFTKIFLLPPELEPKI